MNAGYAPPVAPCHPALQYRTSPFAAVVQDRQSAPELNSAIHRAIQWGVITADDSDDLHAAGDYCIPHADDVDLLFEVSITAYETDLGRAVRRANLLATAADATVITALVSSNMPESQSAQKNASRRQPFYHGIALTRRTKQSG